MGDTLEIGVLVAIIVAAIIAFGVVLFQFVEKVEEWLKRSRDER